jgi:outer membrane protein assembly factor BamA
MTAHGTIPPMFWHPIRLLSIPSCLGLLLLLCAYSPSSNADAELPSSDIVQAESEPPGIDPKSVEAAGATIGKITIKSRNVFDLNNPKDNKLIFHWANQLHIITKPHVIETQLLINEGDAYSVRLSEESERILRQNVYLSEAEIEPVHYENGVVDLEVKTIDVWTLTPELSLGRSGGENRLGIGIIEQNLLGRGIELGATYKKTVDRDTISLLYTDKNFLNDRYFLGGVYSNSSDGFRRQFRFGKPFYALDRQRAGDLFYSRGKQTDQLYDRGNVVAEYNHQFDYHETSLGVSRGLQNDWVRRYTVGITYSRNEFSEIPDAMLPITIIPEDREYLYPFVGFQLIEDRFETTANFDQIHRTEDRFLGKSFNVRLGYSSENANSTEDAWHYRAGYSDALVTTKNTSLTIGSSLSGRWADGGAQNALWSAVTRFHQRLSKGTLFYASLSGTAGENLDIDNPLYLGGETGLRGYPLRYQNGDSKALLTLEQRFFTNWYPFRLVHVGAAVFFDAGRTWGESPVGAPNLGILKDVGVGLRLGNTRSGNGRVLHIDIAFPLDGEEDIDKVQLLIDAKGSF